MAEQALQIPKEQDHSPAARLDQRFIKSLKGKDFVLYNGLLDMGHQIGIKSILVVPVQFPTKENGVEAICKAEIIDVYGRSFTEIGDANPKNVNSHIAVHVLRMAATRAKARALRDMTNIGMTCLEELADIDTIPGAEVIPISKAKRRTNETLPINPNSSEKTTDSDSQAPAENANQAAAGTNNQATISQAQRTAIARLASQKNVTESQLKQVLQSDFKKASIDELSASEASEIINRLKKRA